MSAADSGRVGGARHGDAGIRLFQGWGVVDPVAGHADDVLGCLQEFDDAELVLRKDLGKAVGLLDGFGDWPVS